MTQTTGSSERSEEAARIIVVIPYRDRATNLNKLTPRLHEHLSATLPAVLREVVVIEQHGRQLFNKGRLFNAGFQLYRGMSGYFCLHDVDLIPESQACDYSFSEAPAHLSKYCSQSGYQVVYDWLCGGVMLIRRHHFEAINGFSNEFWGWGGEDDDFALRLRHFGIDVNHEREGRYFSLPHTRPSNQGPGTASHNRNVARLNGRYDYQTDGLNNSSYRVLTRRQTRYYTHWVVDVGLPPPPLRLGETAGTKSPAGRPALRVTTGTLRARPRRHWSR
jgi:hypothetical protein